MITDPCDCGIKPEGHAHVVNNNNEVIFWKGIPITEEQKAEFREEKKSKPKD